MNLTHARTNWPFLAVCALAPLAVLILAAGANPPYPAAQAPAQAADLPGNAPPTAPAGASPLDEPLRFIGEARRAYQGVNDYTCRLIKQERLRGQLQPEQTMVMNVRARPFSINLQFVEPRDVAGQEVCYVAGRNNGMMRVHAKGGIARLAGFVSIDPRDPRVLENSRHSITEAGIGNLIEQFARGWERERPLNKTQVRLADYQFLGHPCTRIEAIHPERVPGFMYYRSVLFLDKETHLPVRVENYDWPRQGGGPEGELLEVFNFTELRVNVGLRDDVFNK